MSKCCFVSSSGASSAPAYSGWILRYPAVSALQRMSDVAAASLILILSDINMPGMTGLELLPKAKAIRPDVPVIMITAYGDADTERKALAGGAAALLTKPIDFDALRNRNRQPAAKRSVIVNCRFDRLMSPNGVINGPRAASELGPLIPGQRTCSDYFSMSVSCQ